MKHRLIALLIAVVFTPVVARAEGLPKKQVAAVDAAVKKEMDRQQLVGVAVGVLHEGRVAYLQGYGLADREKKVPVTTQTVFNWASNSKPLAAVLAMQLVEKKLLDLDADVRSYVPEFPDKGEVITARQLLCHQSGLPHYTNGKVVGTPREHPGEFPYLDPVLAVDKFNQSPLLFKPGTKTSYSTFGTILLCATIQQAGKQPFADQWRERIAKPLGLTSLQYDMPFNGQKDWSVGYRKRGDQVEPLADEAHYWKHGGGGFKSNIEDFARWAEAILNHRLISEASARAMWTSQRTADGKATNFGLGFQVTTVGNELQVAHSGAQAETKTWLAVYPQSRRGLVVLCNCGFADVGAIARAINTALKDARR